MISYSMCACRAADVSRVRCLGRDGADWDQRVARMVVSGDLDLGNILARAWDTEDVKSLRALTAPILTTTDELVAEVVNRDLANNLIRTRGHRDSGSRIAARRSPSPLWIEEPLLVPTITWGRTIRTPYVGNDCSRVRRAGGPP
jgi:hypothetical protein